MQIVSVPVPAKHQITRTDEQELTFTWKGILSKKTYNLKVTTQN